MTPETWCEVDAIVAQALELPENERTAYVAAACAQRLVSRGEVESLLAMADHTNLGRRIGAYVLQEEIGRGGMGTVYLAERADDEFRKKVAIKLIEGGIESLNRFAVERQILATLEHPNIARLLDAGATEDGFPYIVMEYVKGLPITDHCTAHRVSVRGRLLLFHRVCNAVHFAHKHLVVHRDLKPANILVTGAGEPKLLDFGIAKLLGSGAQTLATMPMTPDYASPEQARGVLLTTATDVYSLGVILYELLTGVRPYRVAGGALEEVLQAVCEQQPPKPSAHGGSLDEKVTADLDAIVLHAMSKNPHERYPSAEQFAADIERYLAGRPVTARGGGLAYRTRKFAWRNKLAAAACAAGLALTLAGVTGILWQARIAERERARAERRFSDVRELANSVIFDLHDRIKDLPGSTPARKALVERALHYLDSLSKETHGDASLEAELAAAYERLGDVQGHPRYANLGDTVGALASFRKALAIRESLAAQQPGAFDPQRARWADVSRISESLDALGRNQDTAGFYRREIPIAEAYARGRNEQDIQEWLAAAYYSAATALLENADLGGALEYYQRSAAIREAISEATGPLDIRTRLAGSYGNTAYVLTLERRFSTAVEAQRKAVVTMDRLAAGNPGNTTIQQFHAQAYFFLGEFLRKQGRAKEALEAYRIAGNAYEVLTGRDPRNVLVMRFRAETDHGIGAVLIDIGRPSQSMGYLRKAIAGLESLPAQEPKNLDTYSAIADTYESIGAADEALRHWARALANYRRSQQIWEDIRLQRGSLHPGDIEKPARLKTRIEACLRKAPSR